MKKELHILNALKVNAIQQKEGHLTIEGYACHYGEANHNYEIVTAGSFTGFLAELAESGLKPAFTFNHDSGCIIGGWDELESDSTGLLVRGHINTNVAYVRDNLLPLIESGDLSHLSTEGWAMGEWDERRQAYVCSEFMLTAISLVALPADFAAKMEMKNDLSRPTAKRQYKSFIH